MIVYLRVRAYKVQFTTLEAKELMYWRTKPFDDGTEIRGT